MKEYVDHGSQLALWPRFFSAQGVNRFLCSSAAGAFLWSGNGHSFIEQAAIIDLSRLRCIVPFPRWRCLLSAPKLPHCATFRLFCFWGRSCRKPPFMRYEARRTRRDARGIHSPGENQVRKLLRHPAPEKHRTGQSAAQARQSPNLPLIEGPGML